MADIESKILNKYAIDINQENVFKLYRIDNPELSKEELEVKIAECRKKWNISINGANERNAERDRARLAKADIYEKMLRDNRLRKNLFAYYNKSSKINFNIEFAGEYFKLIASSKKIEKKDVDFFFKYYQGQRKNKKDILEMLKKDFKVINLGKEEKYAPDGEDVDKKGKKKCSVSPLITNLFQEATLLKISKCAGFVTEASTKSDVVNRFPRLRESLYDFLDLDRLDTIEAFSASIVKRREEAANLRLDRGQDYSPLVDLFNTITELIEYRDVVDNYKEFQLLIKYEKLSPYMYMFDEVKTKTLKQFFVLANREYHFRDLHDFVLTYFKPIYDNFAINNSGLGAIFRAAEKKTTSNKILKAVDQALGLNKKKKLPFPALLIYYLLYWPIYFLYLMFGISKAIFTLLRKAAIPLFVILFIGMNLLGRDLVGVDNLLVLRHIISKNKWLEILYDFTGTPMYNWFEVIISTLAYIIYLLMNYAIPPLILSYFVYFFAEAMNKRFDWIGLERTFQHIFKILKEKTESQYVKEKKRFYKKRLDKVFLNLLCLFVVISLIYFAPIGLQGLAKTFENKEYQSVSDYESYDTNESNEDMVEEAIDLDYMEIIVAEANIRAGAGTDYDVLANGKQGYRYIWTGSQESAGNGSTWYEIYLDENMSSVGWASEKVIQHVSE